MSTTFFHTTLSMTLLVAANLTFADDHRGRSLDDRVNQLMSLSRDIRTEIRNDFTGSTSYQHLLSDSTQLQSSVRDIANSIRFNRPVDVISREIRQAQRELNELSVCLDASDFATVRTVRHFTGLRTGGSTRRDIGRHPGYVHYQTTDRMVSELEATLSCLHDDLTRVRPGRTLPSPHRSSPPLPQGHWNGGRPIGNSWTIPSSSQPRSMLSTTMNLGSRGELVFSVPLN